MVRVLLLGTLVAACGGRPSAAAPTATADVCDDVWTDAARQRQVPVRIRLPAGSARVPVILFSHGLGGSLDAGTLWGEAWSRGGFAVVHLQHPGSDETLWRDASAAQRLNAMRTGMSAEQLVNRTRDVAFVLDHLRVTRRSGDCDLSRIDLARVGMSGHSFGAHTTQAVAGQVFPVTNSALREPRIKAAIAFSPAPPARGGEAAARTAFGAIDLPFFSITGTRDEVPALTSTSPADRTLPYRFMPPGDKYLLVMDGADHAAFGGNAAGRIGRSTNTHVRDVVQAASLAFWRATLLGDDAARDWLGGSGLSALLAQGDRFERK